MAQQRVDIFDIISKLQSKNRAVVDQEDQAAPFLLQRWLSGVNDELQILLLNDTINPNLFSIRSHPQLLMSLLISSTSGKQHRCKWIKQLSPKQDNRLVLETISRFYEVTIKDAKRYAQWMSSYDIIEAAAFIGMQPDELKKLKKILTSE